MAKKRRTTLMSGVRRNRLSVVCVSELGRVRFDKRTWVVGTAPLRKEGCRGIALTPRKRSNRIGAVVASTHLRPDGSTIIEAFIHEALHVAFPGTREVKIARAATFVAKVLRAVDGARRSA